MCDHQIARRHARPASALQPDRDGDFLGSWPGPLEPLHPSSQASRSQFAVIMTPLFYRLPYRASKSFHPRSRPPTQRHFTSISRTALRSAVSGSGRRYCIAHMQVRCRRWLPKNPANPPAAATTAANLLCCPALRCAVLTVLAVLQHKLDLSFTPTADYGGSTAVAGVT